MDTKLLTPGPVSVTRTTREAMMLERASGDADFVADLQFARDYLVRLVNGGEDYTAIPVPGSATYANEAAIAALVPPGRTLLIHSRASTTWAAGRPSAPESPPGTPRSGGPRRSGPRRSGPSREPAV